jgi:peptidoglycan/LPS O-acetylase OafA/YrhL
MKERFEVLDVFRGIFASLVVLFHLTVFTATPIINNEFISNGDLFVDFFFVLSGFVITYSYQSIATGNELGRFYKKRFFRLYPLHFILLMIFLAIELSKHTASAYVHVNKIENVSNNATTFFSNLFLLNSVKMPGVHDLSWNYTSWSISAEMIAYLLFGVLIWLMRRFNLIKIRMAVYLLIVCIASAIFYSFGKHFNLLYGFDYGFLRGILGFFTGAFCFNVFDKYKVILRALKNPVFSFLEIVLVAATIIFVYYGRIFKDYGFIYEILFFITVLVFAFEKGWVSGLLKKSKFLHKTGQYSYSIYMVHPLLLSMFNILFIRVLKFQPSAFAYLFILNYILIYYVSAWTFKNIEMRFNQTSSQNGKKTWWLW